MGTSNRYSPEVRERAVRLVLEHSSGCRATRRRSWLTAVWMSFVVSGPMMGETNREVPWNPADHRLVLTRRHNRASRRTWCINSFILTADRNGTSGITWRVGVGRRSKRRQGWLVHTGNA
jgi:hypothetical protein